MRQLKDPRQLVQFIISVELNERIQKLKKDFLITDAISDAVEPVIEELVSRLEKVS